MVNELFFLKFSIFSQLLLAYFRRSTARESRLPCKGLVMSTEFSFQLYISRFMY